MAIIGIDLGSTNSLVSYWDGQKATIIPNALGENITPSVVGIDDNGEILVGKPAKERIITHPQQTASFFKRYMGSKRNYRFGQHNFQPEDLSSFVLRSLKADAEAFLGEPVEEAVISVPAYFNDKQRKATQYAGELAGLKVERLINEPTAAAISYGLHNERAGSFLVFDLGGGTFDVSVLSLFEGIMEVNATAGHNALGGEDFDELIMQQFLNDNDLQKHELDEQSYSRLRWHIESLKRSLTEFQKKELAISLNNKQYTWLFSREKFSEISQSLIDKIRAPIERSLNDAAIQPSQLDEVLLVGGATRMPFIRSLAAKMFGRLPTCHHNPDEVIALGAAVQAGLKSRDQALKDVILTDVCPYSLGTRVMFTNTFGQKEDGYFHPIIERNTVIPVSREEIFSTSEDNQENMQIDIYQGENRLVKNNVKLGEVVVDIPKSPAHEETVSVRFTYDINGILEVDIKVTTTGETKNIVIYDNSEGLSKTQISQRLQELKKLKIHPRETLENRTLIARAERLYEQTLGTVRNNISHAIMQFEDVVNQQNIEDIKNASQTLTEYLDNLEKERI